MAPIKAARWQRKVERGRRMKKKHRPPPRFLPCQPLCQTIAISTPLCSGLPSASQWEVWSEKGGNCSEFAGNWKHLYPPVSPSLPALKTSTPHFPYAHLNALLMAPLPPSCPPSPTGLNWCKRSLAQLLSGRRGDPLVLNFFQLHLLPIVGIDAPPLFPPLPRGWSGLWENWGTPQVFDGFYRFAPDSPSSHLPSATSFFRKRLYICRGGNC